MKQDFSFSQYLQGDAVKGRLIYLTSQHGVADATSASI